MKNKLQIQGNIINLRLENEEGKKKTGLGRIFKIVRDYKEFENIGDIIIYKMIINTLREVGCKITDREIVRHFSNIDKEDYDISEKRQILKDLKETGIKKD